MDEDFSMYPPDSDLDLSFTSTTTDRTFSSSSARTSLARFSLTLSFNESRLSTLNLRPHTHSNPHWSAIKAATTLSPDSHLHLSHLKLTRHLGSGNSARVFLAHLRDYPHATFALKVIDTETQSNKKLLQVQT